jgi:hypothetical protein
MKVHKWSIALLGANFLAAPLAAAEDIPASPSIANSIGVEVAPEFRALKGAIVEGYIKANGSHTFDNGLIWGGSFQYTDKVNGFRQYHGNDPWLQHQARSNLVGALPRRV